LGRAGDFRFRET